MKKKGFTLIELLIVIGILAVLVGAIAAAINPMKQFAQANNARRWADTMNIMNAVSQNIIDNQGDWCPTGTPLPTTTSPCMGDMGQTTTTDCPSYYDIVGCLVPDYIGSLSYDPVNGSWTSTSSYNTYYTITQDATTRRVTITAPASQSENGAAPTISITR